MKNGTKYCYLIIVQGHYGPRHGWEDVGAHERWKDAREELRLYRENEPQYRHRAIRRRVLRQDYEAGRF